MSGWDDPVEIGLVLRGGREMPRWRRAGKLTWERTRYKRKPAPPASGRMVLRWERVEWPRELPVVGLRVFFRNGSYVDTTLEEPLTNLYPGDTAAIKFDYELVRLG